uniref:DnaJ homolog subfamily C member 16 n=1 Tax=Neogobius melanostomus TaxID=47308 RepID=A0A8C6SJL8_9GOBI
MADCRTSLSRGALFLLFLLMLLGSSRSGPELDPYRVLGLSRSASPTEIKKVYKRLAKEWHPDKNKNPGAEDMFIKITKSYEILSNEDKRANYDRYGQLDDTQPYGPRRDNFYFDEAFFNFPFDARSQREFSESRHALHFGQYLKEVVPDSYRRPYLIKVTSDWCFSCIHIEPVWKDVAQEMEALGVGVGVVDVGYERRLANHLGAHRTPSILGLVSGRVSFFHYAVAKEHLLQFVEDLLPQRLVERVNDRNQAEFLSSWHELNKPHVLLFDQVPTVPLLFRLTAFAYKDFLQFGYVDQGLAETSHLQKKFNINTYAPSMLVFKESADKPADIIQAKDLKRPIVDEFISNNKFLSAPRLVHQKLFDELCPVKQFHRRRKFCVLLITDEEDTDGHQAFLTFASENTKEVVRFAYVYQRLQQPLCDVLMHNRALSLPQVLILERRSAGKVLFKAVSSWNGSEEDKLQLREELDTLLRDPSILIHESILPELNNEFASVFVIRWIYASYDYLSEVIEDILHNNWREMMPLLSLIFSALFILFGTVVVQAFSDSSEDKQMKPKPKETTATTLSLVVSSLFSRAPKKNFVEVTELTDITYMSNLVRLRPGHLNIVLVLSDASKNLLLSKFAKEVYSFTGSETLHFSFLNVDKHLEWICALLDQAPDAVPSDEDEEPDQKADYSGFVLALNGHKKYLCLFRPVYTGDEHRYGRNKSRDEYRKSSRCRSLQPHHKLDRLGLWMERLLEGSLPRYYLSAWPGLNRITPK